MAEFYPMYCGNFWRTDSARRTASLRAAVLR
jgi:hypothetical protein